jgi:hypothetical protein
VTKNKKLYNVAIRPIIEKLEVPLPGKEGRTGINVMNNF